jgi:hypothetical protein
MSLFFPILGHGWLLCYDTFYVFVYYARWCECSKVVLFFSLMQLNLMERFYFLHLTLESNCCFDLVCKVVVEVQKKFYSFHLAHG